MIGMDKVLEVVQGFCRFVRVNTTQDIAEVDNRGYERTKRRGIDHVPVRECRLAKNHVLLLVPGDGSQGVVKMQQLMCEDRVVERFVDDEPKDLGVKGHIGVFMHGEGRRRWRTAGS